MKNGTFFFLNHPSDKRNDIFLYAAADDGNKLPSIIDVCRCIPM